MKPSKLLALAAVATFSFGGAVSANAAIINDMFISGENTISDFDAERVVRYDERGNKTVVTSGAFQTGDIIQSILRFTDANASVISDVHGSPYQLNAYAELQIAAIIPTGVFVGANELQRLVFTPTGNLGTGVFANFYESMVSANPFTMTPDAAIAWITSKTLIAQAGLGEADDFWGSTVINDIGVIATAGSGSAQAANGEFGLTFLTNAGGIPYLTNGILSATDGNLHDVVGSSSIYKRNTGVNSGWIASSNTEARFNVPEPGILALMGLGLMGLGLARRR